LEGGGVCDVMLSGNGRDDAKWSGVKVVKSLAERDANPPTLFVNEDSDKKRGRE
jgi:hypothetical protein